MKINLTKFLSSDNCAESVDYNMEIADVELNGVNPFKGPVEVHAELQSFGISAQASSIALDIKASYTLEMPCDRCSEMSEQEENFVTKHMLVTELGDEEDEDGFYILIENEDFDLDELVRSDIVLNLPSKFLCKPDCEGLCSKCGKNLNEGSCDCDKREIDPRLEALKSLLD